MPVTQGRGAHVTQPDGPLATAVDEHIALVWVKLSGGDDFCQLLHVSWLDVHNVWSAKLRHNTWPSKGNLTDSCAVREELQETGHIYCHRGTSPQQGASGGCRTVSDYDRAH